MTVRELIEKLSEFPGDSVIYALDCDVSEQCEQYIPMSWEPRIAGGTPVFDRTDIGIGFENRRFDQFGVLI